MALVSGPGGSTISANTFTAVAAGRYRIAVTTTTKGVIDITVVECETAGVAKLPVNGDGRTGGRVSQRNVLRQVCQQAAFAGLASTLPANFAPFGD